MGSVKIEITSGSSEATNDLTGATLGTTTDTMQTSGLTASTGVSSNLGVNATLRSIGAYSLLRSGINAAEQIITYNLNNYGDLTGDYLTQSKISSTMNIASMGIGVVSSVVSGAMVGGPAGAAVGLAISAINIGVQAYQTSKSLNLAYSKSNYEASANMARLGTILTNGARS